MRQPISGRRLLSIRESTTNALNTQQQHQYNHYIAKVSSHDSLKIEGNGPSAPSLPEDLQFIYEESHVRQSKVTPIIKLESKDRVSSILRHVQQKRTQDMTLQQPDLANLILNT